MESYCEHFGSEGSAIQSGEGGVFLDVEAAIRFVLREKQVPRDKVVVHGLSLGGVYASTAGAYSICKGGLGTAWGWLQMAARAKSGVKN